jgi:hypothetical protein
MIWEMICLYSAGSRGTTLSISYKASLSQTEVHVYLFWKATLLPLKHILHKRVYFMQMFPYKKKGFPPTITFTEKYNLKKIKR